MTCRGIEDKNSCGKRAIRKSLSSFRLTALCDIIADMRADSPSYLAHFGVEPSTVRGPCCVRVMGFGDGRLSSPLTMSVIAATRLAMRPFPGTRPRKSIPWLSVGFSL